MAVIYKGPAVVWGLVCELLYPYHYFHYTRIP
jgi:hypothetical protein